MLRVCVIGLGPIGNLHATLHKADPLAELVGVCDIIKERADAAAARLGVPAFYDAQTMLDALKPDVCSIATAGVENGSDHYEVTLQAFEAGCHVLGEKPICNEIPKAEEMVAKGREKGLCYGIDLNHRFTQAALIAKRWQNEGRLGDLLFINMAMWIMNRNESSPNYMIKSLHPHTVDVMRYFCGDVAAVQCFATRAPGRKIWSTASFNMKFRNGCVGTLSGSYDIERGHPMERCEVAGTKGRLVLEDMWRQATLYPAGDLEKRQFTNPVFGRHRDFDDTFRNRIHRFLEQVTEGVSPEEIDASGPTAWPLRKVLQAAIDSLDTGTVVRL